MNTIPITGKRIVAVGHRSVRNANTGETITAWASMTLDDGTLLYPSVEELEDGYATVLNVVPFLKPEGRKV